MNSTVLIEIYKLNSVWPIAVLCVLYVFVCVFFWLLLILFFRSRTKARTENRGESLNLLFSKKKEEKTTVYLLNLLRTVHYRIFANNNYLQKLPSSLNISVPFNCSIFVEKLLSKYLNMKFWIHKKRNEFV